PRTLRFNLYCQFRPKRQRPMPPTRRLVPPSVRRQLTAATARHTQSQPNRPTQPARRPGHLTLITKNGQNGHIPSASSALHFCSSVLWPAPPKATVEWPYLTAGRLYFIGRAAYTCNGDSSFCDIGRRHTLDRRQPRDGYGWNHSQGYG